MSMNIYIRGVNEANFELPALLARMDTKGFEEDPEAVSTLPQPILEQAQEEKLDCGCRGSSVPKARARRCAAHKNTHHRPVFDEYGYPTVQTCLGCNKQFIVMNDTPRGKRLYCTKVCSSFKHGHAGTNKRGGRRKSPEYSSYQSMLHRCFQQKSQSYSLYGGRGITVFPGWLGRRGFIKFLEDMGLRPKGKYSLERVDVNGNYEPNNCKWATDEEQADNTRRTRRVFFRGQLLTLGQFAKRVGLPRSTVSARLSKGASPEQASLPRQPGAKPGYQRWIADQGEQMQKNELSGVVSLDLRKEPTFTVPPQNIVDAATALQISNDNDYKIAALMIQESTSCIARVEQFFEADKSLAHQLHKSICDKITKFTASWRMVRPTLEPRMKAYQRKVEADRVAREAEQARIAREAQIEAEREARRIQDAADAEAARLRQAGEMRQAREVAAAAQQQAAAVVDQADSLADLGTIEAAPTTVQGVGQAMPWTAEMVEYENEPDRAILELIQAIGMGRIPLRYPMPVRGKKGEYSMERLIEVTPPVLREIGKRMGSENIGVPGARGFREVQLRFSKTAPAPVPQKDEGEW